MLDKIFELFVGFAITNVTNEIEYFSFAIRNEGFAIIRYIKKTKIIEIVVENSDFNLKKYLLIGFAKINFNLVNEELISNAYIKYNLKNDELL